VEIHAPDKPILTLKEALVHLSIVTVGILIALSLEGTLEWVRHRALVRETRQSLQGEMRDNQRDIQFLQAALDKTLPRFQHAIDVVSDLSVPDKLKEAAGMFKEGSGPDRLLSDWIISWPDSASHATAEATGAFGLMPYSEAHRYSDIYEAQALYGRAQDGEIKDVMTAWSFGRAPHGADGPLPGFDMWNRNATNAQYARAPRSLARSGKRSATAWAASVLPARQSA